MDSKALPWILLGVAVVGAGFWYFNRQGPASPLGFAPAPTDATAAAPKKKATSYREVGRMLDPFAKGSVGNQALNSILDSIF